MKYGNKNKYGTEAGNIWKKEYHLSRFKIVYISLDYGGGVEQSQIDIRNSSYNNVPDNAKNYQVSK